jgi:hypothetical protein
MYNVFVEQKNQYYGRLRGNWHYTLCRSVGHRRDSCSVLAVFSRKVAEQGTTRKSRRTGDMAVQDRNIPMPAACSVRFQTVEGPVRASALSIPERSTAACNGSTPGGTLLAPYLVVILHPTAGRLFPGQAPAPPRKISRGECFHCERVRHPLGLLHSHAACPQLRKLLLNAEKLNPKINRQPFPAVDSNEHRWSQAVRMK